VRCASTDNIVRWKVAQYSRSPPIFEEHRLKSSSSAARWVWLLSTSACSRSQMSPRRQRSCLIGGGGLTESAAGVSSLYFPLPLGSRGSDREGLVPRLAQSSGGRSPGLHGLPLESSRMESRGECGSPGKPNPRLRNVRTYACQNASQGVGGVGIPSRIEIPFIM